MVFKTLKNLFIDSTPLQIKNLYEAFQGVCQNFLSSSLDIDVAMEKFETALKAEQLSLHSIHTDPFDQTQLLLGTRVLQDFSLISKHFSLLFRGKIRGVELQDWELLLQENLRAQLELPANHRRPILPTPPVALQALKQSIAASIEKVESYPQKWSSLCALLESVEQNNLNQELDPPTLEKVRYALEWEKVVLPLGKVIQQFSQESSSQESNSPSLEDSFPHQEWSADKTQKWGPILKQANRVQLSAAALVDLTQVSKTVVYVLYNCFRSWAEDAVTQIEKRFMNQFTQYIQSGGRVFDHIENYAFPYISRWPCNSAGKNMLQILLDVRDQYLDFANTDAAQNTMHDYWYVVSKHRSEFAKYFSVSLDTFSQSSAYPIADFLLFIAALKDSCDASNWNEMAIYAADKLKAFKLEKIVSQIQHRDFLPIVVEQLKTLFAQVTTEQSPWKAQLENDQEVLNSSLNKGKASASALSESCDVVNKWTCYAFMMLHAQNQGNLSDTLQHIKTWDGTLYSKETKQPLAFSFTALESSPVGQDPAPQNQMTVLGFIREFWARFLKAEDNSQIIENFKQQKFFEDPSFVNESTGQELLQFQQSTAEVVEYYLQQLTLDAEVYDMDFLIAQQWHYGTKLPSAYQNKLHERRQYTFQQSRKALARFEKHVVNWFGASLLSKINSIQYSRKAPVFMAKLWVELQDYFWMEQKLCFLLGDSFQEENEETLSYFQEYSKKISTSLIIPHQHLFLQESEARRQKISQLVKMSLLTVFSEQKRQIFTSVQHYFLKDIKETLEKSPAALQQLERGKIKLLTGSFLQKLAKSLKNQEFYHTLNFTIDAQMQKGVEEFRNILLQAIKNSYQKRHNILDDQRMVWQTKELFLHRVYMSFIQNNSELLNNNFHEFYRFSLSTPYPAWYLHPLLKYFSVTNVFKVPFTLYNPHPHDATLAEAITHLNRPFPELETIEYTELSDWYLQKPKVIDPQLLQAIIQTAQKMQRAAIEEYFKIVAGTQVPISNGAAQAAAQYATQAAAQRAAQSAQQHIAIQQLLAAQAAAHHASADAAAPSTPAPAANVQHVASITKTHTAVPPVSSPTAASKPVSVATTQTAAAPSTPAPIATAQHAASAAKPHTAAPPVSSPTAPSKPVSVAATQTAAVPSTSAPIATAQHAASAAKPHTAAPPVSSPTAPSKPVSVAATQTAAVPSTSAPAANVQHAASTVKTHTAVSPVSSPTAASKPISIVTTQKTSALPASAPASAMQPSKLAVAASGLGPVSTVTVQPPVLQQNNFLSYTAFLASPQAARLKNFSKSATQRIIDNLPNEPHYKPYLRDIFIAWQQLCAGWSSTQDWSPQQTQWQDILKRINFKTHPANASQFKNLWTTCLHIAYCYAVEIFLSEWFIIHQKNHDTQDDWMNDPVKTMDAKRDTFLVESQDRLSKGTTAIHQLQVTISKQMQKIEILVNQLSGKLYDHKKLMRVSSAPQLSISSPPPSELLSTATSATALDHPHIPEELQKELRDDIASLKSNIVLYLKLRKQISDKLPTYYRAEVMEKYLAAKQLGVRLDKLQKAAKALATPSLLLWTDTPWISLTGQVNLENMVLSTSEQEQTSDMPSIFYCIFFKWLDKRFSEISTFYLDELVVALDAMVISSDPVFAYPLYDICNVNFSSHEMLDSKKQNIFMILSAWLFQKYSDRLKQPNLMKIQNWILSVLLTFQKDNNLIMLKYIYDFERLGEQIMQHEQAIMSMEKSKQKITSESTPLILSKLQQDTPSDSTAVPAQTPTPEALVVTPTVKKNDLNEPQTSKAESQNSSAEALVTAPTVHAIETQQQRKTNSGSSLSLSHSGSSLSLSQDNAAEKESPTSTSRFSRAWSKLSLSKKNK